MRIKGSHIPWIAALLAILVAKVESQNVKSQNVWPNPWPSGETTGWPNPRPKSSAVKPGAIPYGKVQILESCYDCSPDWVHPDAAIGFEWPAINLTCQGLCGTADIQREGGEYYDLSCGKKTPCEAVIPNNSGVSWYTGTAINNAPAVEIKCASWKPKPTGCKLQDGKTLDDLVYVLVEREKSHR